MTRTIFFKAMSRMAGGALLTLSALFSSAPASAAGDLLVAPTRVILDGRRGTEVILNNIGAEEATYRISLELYRMNAEGRLDEVTPETANDKEKAALEIIRLAPRRVTLPPNQPQSIRIGVQGMENIPDGEYRAHMLFRAIPKADPVTQEQDAGNGVKISLIPIYGVTIPIIVRKGELHGTAALANVHMAKDNEGPTVNFDLTRKGDRSVFGEIHISKAGVAEPIAIVKGLAIYPERESRLVSIPLTAEQAAQMHGDIKISYIEAPEAGGGEIASVRQVLP